MPHKQSNMPANTHNTNGTAHYKSIQTTPLTRLRALMIARALWLAVALCSVGLVQLHALFPAFEAEAAAIPVVEFVAAALAGVR